MIVIPFPDPEEKLVAAVREYLADLTRGEQGAPEWETEPDYALLAVVRVMLSNICYERYVIGDEEDGLVVETIDRLVKRLDKLGCRRAAAVSA